MATQVPYLPEEAIEQDAEDLLKEFAQARGITLKPPIPIEDIVGKHLTLKIDFDDLHEFLGVPQLTPEPDILGALWVGTREIRINEFLDPEEHPAREGRYRFTVAHEGAHWRLHRSYLSNNPAQFSLLDGAGKPSFICRSSEARERVEWQADAHAACTLMPRTMVWAAWHEELGIASPLGHDLLTARPPVSQLADTGLSSAQRIRMNPRAGEPRLVDTIAKHLASIFKVSVQAMRIRLERLGLLPRDARSFDQRAWQR